MQTPLENLSLKHLQELEVLITNLRKAMKKTGLQHDKLFEDLTEMENQLGRTRCARFDSTHPNFTQSILFK